MNKERILSIADLIEVQPHTCYEARNGFSMEALTHEHCNTPCCIAGWTIWGARGRPFNSSVEVSNLEVANYLGLNHRESFNLCYPHKWIDQDNWGKITPKQAASVLRNLTITGEVDWSQVAEEL